MELLKSLLDEETYAQVENQLKDKDIKLVNLKEGNYVDKSKYESIVTELDTTKNELSQRTQDLTKLSELEGLSDKHKEELEKIKVEFEQKEVKYQEQLERDKFNSIVELEVIKSGTIDPVGVKAHLNEFLKEAKVEDGVIAGLDEKLNTIKTEMKHYYPNEKLNGSSGLEGKVVPNKTTREEVMSGFGLK